jgi:hypothetical protein
MSLTFKSMVSAYGMNGLTTMGTWDLSMAFNGGPGEQSTDKL